MTTKELNQLEPGTYQLTDTIGNQYTLEVTRDIVGYPFYQLYNNDRKVTIVHVDKDGKKELRALVSVGLFSVQQWVDDFDLRHLKIKK